MFDLLLTNATVATMADDSPFGLVRDGAVGIADGKIAWVGPAAQAPREAGTVRDLGGKVVTPGLVDPHTHIVYGEEGLSISRCSRRAASAGTSSRRAAASAPW